MKQLGTYSVKEISSQGANKLVESSEKLGQGTVELVSEASEKGSEERNVSNSLLEGGDEISDGSGRIRSVIIDSNDLSTKCLLEEGCNVFLSSTAVKAALANGNGSGEGLDLRYQTVDSSDNIINEWLDGVFNQVLINRLNVGEDRLELAQNIFHGCSSVAKDTRDSSVEAQI